MTQLRTTQGRVTETQYPATPPRNMNTSAPIFPVNRTVAWFTQFSITHRRPCCSDMALDVHHP